MDRIWERHKGWIGGFKSCAYYGKCHVGIDYVLCYYCMYVYLIYMYICIYVPL